MPNASRRGWPRRVDVARVEAGILQPHRPHADGDGVGGGAQLVHEPAGLLPGDPARAGNRDAAVQRHRGLVGDERPTLRDPGAPGLVLAPRLDAVGELDLDALGLEPFQAATRLGVRVARAGDDTRDPGCEHGVDARWCGAVVRARLHRHVERRAAGLLAGGLEGDDFSVPTRGLGRALADDLVSGDDDGPDRRLGIGPAARVLGELQGSLQAHVSACTKPR